MKKVKSTKTKKLSVVLDGQLHNQAKRFALLNDMTLTELITLLLQERLDQASTAIEAVRPES
jgi:hypothetical protein